MSKEISLDDIKKFWPEKAPDINIVQKYVSKYEKEKIVIKYGGNVLIDRKVFNNFISDIDVLNKLGLSIIVVHGGGPQIGSVLKKLSIQSEFIDGLRVTDSQTMDVVEMVLGGLVNKEIVNLLNQNQGRAIGVSGKDGKLIKAKKLRLKQKKQRLTDEIIDIGHVGEVVGINTEILDVMKDSNFIPVIAPIGTDDSGTSFNINADSVAGEIAIVMGAEKLILLTNVEGVKDKTGNVLTGLTPIQASRLITNRTLKDGMVPKVQCAVNAIKSGVTSAHIIDGRVEHAVLLEIFTDEGVGTLITKRAKKANNL